MHTVTTLPLLLLLVCCCDNITEHAYSIARAFRKDFFLFCGSFFFFFFAFYSFTTFTSFDNADDVGLCFCFCNKPVYVILLSLSIWKPGRQCFYIFFFRGLAHNTIFRTKKNQNHHSPLSVCNSSSCRRMMIYCVYRVAMYPHCGLIW